MLKAVPQAALRIFPVARPALSERRAAIRVEPMSESENEVETAAAIEPAALDAPEPEIEAEPEAEPEVAAEPEAQTPFSQLPAPLAEALTERGYAEPTSVQAAVLEPQALGRDMIVSAQTGSGKTIAFGIAIMRELLADGAALPPAGSPQIGRAHV